MERKQKIAKKIVLVAIFLAIALESAVAKNFTNDGGEGKAIDFRQPTVITSGKNYASIAGILKNNLEEVWLNYSNMQIVASDHEKRSTDIQKKSESALYSEKTAIESGNFVIQNFTADTKIFISEKGTFRATIRIVDNEKNSVVANYETEDFENEDSFCTYAANDIAINVMPKLGIELTTNAKSILSYRKNNPNETVQEAELYYSNLSVSIDEIDEKISAIEKTKMDAQTAIAEKSRLEAEKKQRLMQ